ncbi:Vesicle transport v-SNARE 13 [Sesamum angolense]|uniref:Vesicle transport v-SNARE 13 n=1 Tax=Sesamum angolense TaxID=2727404 RepID=A0AAE1WZ49_9LAMI|nr:Vesicle transport v-SNARE 13 [Sesamum angolense]
MSQVFEGYERQYCELSANLSKKITSASLLDGEQKKQKVSEIKGGFEDAVALASADQRTRLMMSTERLNQSSDRIRESRKTMLETEELGVSILQDLHQQRQSLLHAHNTLHGVDDTISRSKKVLTNMSRRMSRNKWIIGSIITVLVFAIILILYFKLTH